MQNPARLFHENEKIIYRDVKTEMEKSFLDYSMSVIVARALPDVRDGLKPVHRRILFCQHKKGLTNDKPYHKCADTVGSVLGEFHPHGDASVYDALVRLAQDFSLRYPLVDGHGNFGSVDADPPAAYRYTEARLSKISNEMLRDIAKDTVDWQPNFDDRLEEPTTLPSRFPNLLVNGSMGIAVGMATNIPPHNLRDTIAAVNILIAARKEGRDTDISELITAIKAPDFPTGGIIMGKAGVNAAYRTGRGKIIVRGKAEIVEHKGHDRILVTEIPYMVNKAEMCNKIGLLQKEKRVEGITEVHDETGRDGMRVVIDVKKGTDANIVLNHLYRFTELQSSFGVNMVALVGGIPKTITLKDALEKYLDFQEEVVTRRVKFDLKKAEKRLNILVGLLLAIDNIDEVIKILRGSKNVTEGKARLIERFMETDLTKLLVRAMQGNETEIDTGFFSDEIGLSAEQADAIVAMTLGQLTGLEREKTENELRGLAESVKGFKEILGSRSLLLGVIEEELAEIAKKYGDERRT
ncbi:MAG: DNA topoisomerase 4 subunit A, partial [Oscillospiraceae bacterium]|nr:DNA topoisomerase 4 subunit A [Oscillospiraceae bacterium]